MDSTGSEQSPIVGYCEYVNVPCISIEAVE